MRLRNAAQVIFTVREKHVSVLITLTAARGYFRQSVVWYVAEKEARKMRKTLEDLYYGNISPFQRQMTPDSELKRAVDRVAQYESQLTEQLDETTRTILTKLIRSQHEIDSITALENFILGFRLGVRIMSECMDNNDGDIREVSDHS